MAAAPTEAPPLAAQGGERPPYPERLSQQEQALLTVRWLTKRADAAAGRLANMFGEDYEQSTPAQQRGFRKLLIANFPTARAGSRDFEDALEQLDEISPGQRLPDAVEDELRTNTHDYEAIRWYSTFAAGVLEASGISFRQDHWWEYMDAYLDDAEYVAATLPSVPRLAPELRARVESAIFTEGREGRRIRPDWDAQLTDQLAQGELAEIQRACSSFGESSVRSALIHARNEGTFPKIDGISTMAFETMRAAELDAVLQLLHAPSPTERRQPLPSTLAALASEGVERAKGAVSSIPRPTRASLQARLRLLTDGAMNAIVGMGEADVYDTGTNLSTQVRSLWASSAQLARAAADRMRPVGQSIAPARERPARNVPSEPRPPRPEKVRLKRMQRPREVVLSEEERGVLIAQLQQDVRNGDRRVFFRHLHDQFGHPNPVGVERDGFKLTYTLLEKAPPDFQRQYIDRLAQEMWNARNFQANKKTSDAHRQMVERDVYAALPLMVLLGAHREEDARQYITKVFGADGEMMGTALHFLGRLAHNRRLVAPAEYYYTIASFSQALAERKVISIADVYREDERFRESEGLNFPPEREGEFGPLIQLTGRVLQRALGKSRAQAPARKPEENTPVAPANTESMPRPASIREVVRGVGLREGKVGISELYEMARGESEGAVGAREVTLQLQQRVLLDFFGLTLADMPEGAPDHSSARTDFNALSMAIFNNYWIGRRNGSRDNVRAIRAAYAAFQGNFPEFQGRHWREANRAGIPNPGRSFESLQQMLGRTLTGDIMVHQERREVALGVKAINPTALPDKVFLALMELEEQDREGREVVVSGGVPTAMPLERELAAAQVLAPGLEVPMHAAEEGYNTAQWYEFARSTPTNEQEERLHDEARAMLNNVHTNQIAQLFALQQDADLQALRTLPELQAFSNAMIENYLRGPWQVWVHSPGQDVREVALHDAYVEEMRIAFDALQAAIISRQPEWTRGQMKKYLARTSFDVFAKRYLFPTLAFDGNIEVEDARYAAAHPPKLPTWWDRHPKTPSLAEARQADEEARKPRPSQPNPNLFAPAIGRLEVPGDHLPEVLGDERLPPPKWENINANRPNTPEEAIQMQRRELQVLGHQVLILGRATRAHRPVTLRVGTRNVTLPGYDIGHMATVILPTGNPQHPERRVALADFIAEYREAHAWGRTDSDVQLVAGNRFQIQVGERTATVVPYGFDATYDSEGNLTHIPASMLAYGILELATQRQSHPATAAPLDRLAEIVGNYGGSSQLRLAQPNQIAMIAGEQSSERTTRTAYMVSRMEQVVPAPGVPPFPVAEATAQRVRARILGRMEPAAYTRVFALRETAIGIEQEGGRQNVYRYDPQRGTVELVARPGSLAWAMQVGLLRKEEADELQSAMQRMNDYSYASVTDELIRQAISVLQQRVERYLREDAETELAGKDMALFLHLRSLEREPKPPMPRDAIEATDGHMRNAVATVPDTEATRPASQPAKRENPATDHFTEYFFNEIAGQHELDSLDMQIITAQAHVNEATTNHQFFAARDILEDLRIKRHALAAIRADIEGRLFTEILPSHIRQLPILVLSERDGTVPSAGMQQRIVPANPHDVFVLASGATPPARVAAALFHVLQSPDANRLTPADIGERVQDALLRLDMQNAFLRDNNTQAVAVMEVQVGSGDVAPGGAPEKKPKRIQSAQGRVANWMFARPTPVAERFQAKPTLPPVEQIVEDAEHGITGIRPSALYDRARGLDVPGAARITPAQAREVVHAFQEDVLPRLMGFGSYEAIPDAQQAIQVSGEHGEEEMQHVNLRAIFDELSARISQHYQLTLDAETMNIYEETRRHQPIQDAYEFLRYVLKKYREQYSQQKGSVPRSLPSWWRFDRKLDKTLVGGNVIPVREIGGLLQYNLQRRANATTV